MDQVKNRIDSWIILSDIHLGGFDSSTNSQLMNEFKGVVKYAKLNGFGLIINGDLFDYYMEFAGKVPPVVEEGVAILVDFLESTKIPPVYITGNHDNWDDGYLEKHGFIVIHEEFRTQFDSQHVFVAHGDGLNDPKYGLPRPLMHQILRNPTFIRIFKALTTVRTGNWIMKWFSRMNRRFDVNNEKTTLRIDDWAKTMLQNESIDVVITAHHHHPRFQKFNNKLYLNSGCFYLDRTSILYTNNGFELVRWDNQTQTFIPFISGN